MRLEGSDDKHEDFLKNISLSEIKKVFLSNFLASFINRYYVLLDTP
jgi:hypothetical protein